MLRAIIFDFDGVLVESVDLKTGAFAKLFAAEGEDVVRKVVEYHLGNTGVSRFDKFRYIYKNILNRELSEEKFADLCRDFADLVMSEVVAAPYVKGAAEFLDNFSSKYAYFIASATPQEEIEDIVRRRKIAHHFKGVYGSPMPKVDIVKEIISKNGFSPRELIYVGDAMSDYKAAMGNKVPFIARINNNEKIFLGVDCPRVKDLTGFEKIITIGKDG
ncbi:MAG: HAD hydrolase-like protein [Candidatus Omnitrophica bacterium]|nr:HAD hydrolase-like protein [Candidatus Omnitrophota bacterium]